MHSYLKIVKNGCMASQFTISRLALVKADVELLCDDLRRLTRGPISEEVKFCLTTQS
jgi:hypothetical protein